MADDVDIRIRLRDAAQAAQGVHQVRDEIDELRPAARRAAQGVQQLGSAVSHAASVGARGMSLLAYHSRYAGVAVAGAGVAAVKMGLTYNAQVESARERFRLFTNDVNGLSAAVSKIDMSSAFNFADLSDAAALLGNSGVQAQRIPQILQGIANAAAASGKGTAGLQQMALAISQIASKGRLQGDELLQLTEAGAPGVQRTIQQQFGLTAKQLGNIGAQGLSANEAIGALTKTWTSGKMAQAASRQIHTLGGQWDYFTGALQKTAGAATEGLANGLEHNVLPAASRAADKITQIFGDKGLTDTEKLRRARKVIERELGPVWDGIKRDIDQADIPGHLGDAVGAAIPKMAAGAAHAAPHVASAFVSAWLNSGPWAQLLSALYLGKKFGAGSLVTKGLGSAIGKAASSELAAKGSTPANPMWVAVVNGTPGAPGLPGKGDSPLDKIRKAGRYAGPLAVGAAYWEFVHALNQTGGDTPGLSAAAASGGIRNPQTINPRVAGAVLNAALASSSTSTQTLDTRGLVGGFPLETTVNVNLDGQRADKSVVRARAKAKARK